MYLKHYEYHTKYLHPISTAIGIMAIIALVALSGCAPALTAAVGPVLTDIPGSSVETNLQSSPTCPPSVFLRDGAEIFLRTDSRIEIIKISDPTVGQSGDEISLSHGEIVVNSLLPVDKWVEVVSPNGFIARLAGPIMIVAYEGTGGQFTVACVDGVCKIGPDAQHITDLAANSQASLDKDGNFLGPFAISLENLPATCETIFHTPQAPTETATFTPEPLSTPDTAATATAACQEFHDKFPKTPTCP